MVAKAWICGPETLVAAITGGGPLATALWQLLQPRIGFDSWILSLQPRGGGMGPQRPPGLPSSRSASTSPYGNYPVTDEVALTWAAGISRS